MQGINRHTGQRIYGWDYVFQLIDDLFTTRFRERLQRRTYGSEVPDAIDKPINDQLTLDTFMKAADAIEKWLSRVVAIRGFGLLSATQDGKTRFSIFLTRLDTGEINTYEAVI